MALSITTNYKGKASAAFLYPAIAGAPTLKGDVVTFHPGIKDDLNITLLTTPHNIVAHSCDFSAAGDITLTESVLTPVKLKVNKTYCIDDLEAHWESAKMQAGQWAKEPPSFKKAVLELQAMRTAESIEQAIWQANTTGSTSTYFDSFAGLLQRASGANNQTKEAGAFSASNIIANLQKGYNAVPAAVFENMSDMKIYCDWGAWRFYQQALAAASAESYYAGAKPNNFLGIELFPTNGMPANTLVFARKRDLHVGTDLRSDFNEVRLIDMRDNDGSDNVRLVQKFKLGTQIAYPDNVVKVS